MAGAAARRTASRYIGVDASERMVEAARGCNPGLAFVVGAHARSTSRREPVDATICLRAFYYPDDRVAFFRRVAGYTTQKFVFDFRQRRALRRSWSSATCGRRASRGSSCGRTSCRSAAPAGRSRAYVLEALERTGPLALFLSPVHRPRLLQRERLSAPVVRPDAAAGRRRSPGVYASVALGLASALVVLRVLGPDAARAGSRSSSAPSTSSRCSSG